MGAGDGSIYNNCSADLLSHSLYLACVNAIAPENLTNTVQEPISPLAFYADYVLGVLLIFLTAFGIVSNVLVIILLTKVKDLQTRTSYLLRSLAISDLIMASVGGSMYCINAFHHRWIFTEYGCQFYAMVMYWCGVTSIAHLCAISIERCITMNSPFKSVTNRKKIPVYIHVMVIFSWLYGFIWALLPLVGIHSYVVEGRVSCSLDWNSGHPHAFFYNILIFISTFAFPFLIVMLTNGQILYMIKRRFNSQMGADKKKEQNKKKEWQLTKNIMQATGFYMLAWTPYSIVSMWSAFGDPSFIPDVMFSWLAFFAKMSFFFNPCVYCFNNPRHQKALKVLLFGKRGTRKGKSAGQENTIELLPGGGRNFSIMDEATKSEELLSVDWRSTSLPEVNSKSSKLQKDSTMDSCIDTEGSD